MKDWLKDNWPGIGIIICAICGAWILLSAFKGGLQGAHREDRAIADSRSVAQTVLPEGGRMYTVKHDGHLWVFVAGDGRPVHHPSCPCQTSSP